MKPYEPRRVEVAGVTYEIRDLLSILDRPPDSDSADSPENRNQSPPEANSEALSVGALVRHRLSPGLLGRIVEINRPLAKIELLTWPPDDWWSRWGKRPVPVRVENLELAE